MQETLKQFEDRLKTDLVLVVGEMGFCTRISSSLHEAGSLGQIILPCRQHNMESHVSAIQRQTPSIECAVVDGDILSPSGLVELSYFPIRLMLICFIHATDIRRDYIYDHCETLFEGPKLSLKLTDGEPYTILLVNR